MYIFARKIQRTKNHCNCYKTVTKELNKNTLNKKNMSLLIYLLYYSTTKIHSSFTSFMNSELIWATRMATVSTTRQNLCWFFLVTDGVYRVRSEKKLQGQQHGNRRILFQCKLKLHDLFKFTAGYYLALYKKITRAIGSNTI